MMHRYQTELRRWLVAATLLVVGLAPVRAVELLGPSPLSLLAGIGSVAQVEADVDGNGITDLLLVNRGENTLTIALADGTGGFSQTTLPVGQGPQDLVVADFNSDGNLDVAVVHVISRDVLILTGDGAGVFSAGHSFVAGEHPRALVAGHFNDDAEMDLAVADRKMGAVHLFFNDGAGGFLQGADQPTGGEPEVLVSADINHDDIDDLLVVNRDDDAVLLLAADGSGGFANTRSSMPGLVLSVAAFDLDQNETQDMAVLVFHPEYNPGEAFELLLWSGAGTGEFTQVRILPAGFSDVVAAKGAIAALDVDLDDDVDLIVAHRGSEEASVFLGSSTQPFGYTIANGLPIDGELRAVGLADFSGDGVPDLSLRTASQGPAAVRVVKGNGFGGFEQVGFERVSTDLNLESLEVGDVDGDGYDDLVVEDDSQGRIYLNDTQGGFVPVLDRVIRGNTGCRSLADLNLDGRADTIDNFGRTVTVSFSDGQGGVASTTTFDGVTQGVGFLECSPAGNFVGDDNPDILVGTITLDGNFRLDTEVWSGDGLGNFEFTTVWEGPFIFQVGRGVEGDFNDDGLSDFAVPSNIPDNTIYVFMGGIGYIGTVSPGLGGRMFLAAGDLDADGADDLVVTTRTENQIAVMSDFADGDFRNVRYQPVANQSRGNPIATDLNGDGFVDLVLVHRDSLITVHIGDGTGGLTPVADIATRRQPQWQVAGDFNADGRVDLAVGEHSSSYTSEVTLLYNQVELRADTNGSNLVDGLDVNAVTRLLGATLGEPQYRKVADVDLNGVINGGDLSLVAQRFGQFNQSVSPLRPSLEFLATADPDTVTLQPPPEDEATGNDELIVDVRVHEIDDAVSSASFTLGYSPNDGNPAELLEFLGLEPGDYLADSGLQAMSQSVPDPGQVRIVVSRLPQFSEVLASEVKDLVRLRFRARREGTADLMFEGNSQLLNGVGQPVDANFVGGASVEVTATGAAAAGQRIAVLPQRVDFGTVDIGSDRRRTIRISNLGYSELRVSNVTSTQPDGPFGSHFTEAFDIAPFSFVELAVTFSPTTPGAFGATLVIENDDRDIPPVVLEGHGR